MLKRFFVVSSSVLSFAVLFTVFVIPSEASTNEVLYVAGPQGSSNVMLYAYSVDPTTAVATQIGNPLNVASGSLIPLTIGTNHYLYLWNTTGVSLYRTHADGALGDGPQQHVRFSFAHPVVAFLVDLKGNFAYAALGWTDSQGYETEIVLFTIDQSTGQLTNTNEVVASYTNEYTGFTSFQFSPHGGKLLALFSDNGPYTSAIGFDYYPVNQTTGKLGKLQNMFYAQTYECGSSCGVAATDLLSAYDGVCCSTGSGEIVVTLTASNGKKQASCPPPSSSDQTSAQNAQSDNSFCSDNVATLAIDPANKNVFFGDKAASETYILNVDFPSESLNPSSSTIPGTPPIYFSPDSQLVYAINANDIGIYALDTASGNLIASATLPDAGQVSIAAVSLEE